MVRSFVSLSSDVGGRQNGMEGKIVGRNAHRYRVRLKQNNALVEVGGRNVQQIVEEATLYGLQSRPELNGQTVRLVNFDQANGKYQGFLDGSDGPQLIRPQNVILPPHTRVRIAGLVNRPEFNGEVATILSYSKAEMKYSIQLGGRELKIPNRNVFAG
eukprot:jgi/Bigna1/135148/aug1.28_g9856